MSEFDFNQWLTEARVATRSVDVIQRPDLIADYQEWQRRFDRAKLTQPAVEKMERGIGDPDPIALLEDEGRALLEQIQASRSTFYLSALSETDQKGIEAAFPLPDSPVTFDLELPVLADGATEKQADAFLAAWDAWKVAQARFVDENAEILTKHQEAWNQANQDRNAERLARSITAIRQGGELHKVRLSSDQVRVLAKKIGNPQVDRLIAALNAANTDDPEKAVPAAFLSRS